MAEWGEGAEVHHTLSELTKKYAQVSGSPGATGVGQGRTGGRAMSFNGAWLGTPSLGVADDWILHFGLKVSSSPENFQFNILNGATEQLRIEGVAGSPYELRIVRGSTVLATTSLSIPTGVWNYYELKVNIHPSTGSYELRQNETVVIAQATGQNTAESGSNGADVFQFGHFGSSGSSLDMDDIMIVPTTTYLGDSAGYAINPDGDGNSSQWTPQTGPNNYTNIDDPNGAPNDADYVQSGTNGQKDLYTYTDLPATGLGTIHFLMVAQRVALDISGTRTVKTKFRESGGSEGDGGTFSVNSTMTAERMDAMNQNPVGPKAWTKADIDAGEFGIEVVS